MREDAMKSHIVSLIVIVGVVSTASLSAADTIVERVQLTSPEVRPTRSRFEPIIGVLFSAFEAAGKTIGDGLLERLVPSLPSSELFATASDYTLR